MTGFTDKGIVVTGAARGMGLAIAQRFHAEGATVVMFDLDGEELARAAAGLGARAIAVTGDVSRRSDVRTAVETCVAAAGHVDVCVAHAGTATDQSSRQCRAPARRRRG